MRLEAMQTETVSELRETEHSRFHQKLVIVSHVTHFRSAGRLYAYAPYAREIEIWADLFDEIVIAAPSREQEPPGDCAPIDRANVRVAPQRELGGETLGAKLKLAFAAPLMAWDLCTAMRARRCHSRALPGKSCRTRYRSRSAFFRETRRQVCRSVESGPERALEHAISTFGSQFELVARPGHGLRSLAQSARAHRSLL